MIVDSNVLLDILGPDPQWRDWSVARLDEAAAHTGVAVNFIIYAEIAPRFRSAAELDGFLADARLEMLDFSRAQIFSAGVAHRRYRRSGGQRRRVLPDFFIGAQAQAMGRTLLTRDPGAYRTYFPDVRLITP